MHGIYEKPRVGEKALEINKDLGRGKEGLRKRGGGRRMGEGDEGGWGGTILRYSRTLFACRFTSLPWDVRVSWDPGICLKPVVVKRGPCFSVDAPRNPLAWAWVQMRCS